MLKTSLYQVETVFTIHSEDNEQPIVHTNIDGIDSFEDYLNVRPNTKKIVYDREKDWENDNQYWRLIDLILSLEKFIRAESITKVLTQKRKWKTF